MTVWDEFNITRPSLVADGASDAVVALEHVMGELAAVVNVKRVGGVGDGIANDEPRFLEALALADEKAAAYSDELIRGVVYAPFAKYNVNEGLSVDGFSSTIVSDGAMLHAPNQTGPVLDTDGWVSPPNLLGTPEFRGLVLRGSGVGDPTLANKGLKVRRTNQVRFRDFVVTECGGEPLYIEGISLGDSDLDEFLNFILHQPVDGNANNVPYFRVKGVCVGTTFRRLGLRNNAVAADAKYAGVLEGDGTAAPLDTKFFDCWSENIHVPTDGRIIYDASDYGSVHADWTFYDSQRVAGATGTAFVEFADADADESVGGKLFTGIVPGGLMVDPGDGNHHGLHDGVVLSQWRNRVVGIKGYTGGSPGANVVLASGVKGSHVELGGSVGTAGTGIIDNSGNNENYIEDQGIISTGGVTVGIGQGVAGLELIYTAASGNPTLMLRDAASGKQYEVRIDPVTHEFVIDYWNGAGRIPDILKLNVDGTLELAGNLAVAAAFVLAGKLVSVGAADSGGSGFKLLRVPN